MDVRAFGSWTSAPKCLFFQDFEGLTEVFAPGRPPGYPRGRPAGYPAPKLTLWADFPFLIQGHASKNCGSTCTRLKPFLCLVSNIAGLI